MLKLFVKDGVYLNETGIPLLAIAINNIAESFNSSLQMQEQFIVEVKVVQQEVIEGTIDEELAQEH